jgi:hypothetical protein
VNESTSGPLGFTSGARAEFVSPGFLVSLKSPRMMRLASGFFFSRSFAQIFSASVCCCCRVMPSAPMARRRWTTHTSNAVAELVSRTTRCLEPVLQSRVAGRLRGDAPAEVEAEQRPNILAGVGVFALREQRSIAFVILGGGELGEVQRLATSANLLQADYQWCFSRKQSDEVSGLAPVFRGELGLVEIFACLTAAKEKVTIERGEQH